VAPDGDRRHDAESGDVIGEILRIVEWDEHVMSEFVLRDDLFDSPCRRLGPAPFKDTLERGLASYRGLKIAESGVRETSVIDQKHRHTGTYIGGAPNGMRLSCSADLRQASTHLRLARGGPAHKRNSSPNRAPSASSTC